MINNIFLMVSLIKLCIATVQSSLQLMFNSSEFGKNRRKSFVLSNLTKRKVLRVKVQLSNVLEISEDFLVHNAHNCSYCTEM